MLLDLLDRPTLSNQFIQGAFKNIETVSLFKLEVKSQ